MHLPKRHGKAGGALMISDKELPLAGQLQALLLVNINIITSPGKQFLHRISRSPTTSHAGNWSQEGLYAQAHVLELDFCEPKFCETKDSSAQQAKQDIEPSSPNASSNSTFSSETRLRIGLGLELCFLSSQLLPTPPESSAS